MTTKKELAKCYKMYKYMGGIMKWNMYQSQVAEIERRAKREKEEI